MIVGIGRISSSCSEFGLVIDVGIGVVCRLMISMVLSVFVMVVMDWVVYCFLVWWIYSSVSGVRIMMLVKLFSV